MLYSSICTVCGKEVIQRKIDFKLKNTTCRHQYNKWKISRIGCIYGNMLDRCYNKNNKSFRWYGKKGIKICDEWMNCPSSFEEWSINNGYKDGLTIDRIKDDGNYCPENCRWIPMEENSRDKSTTRYITVNGIKLSGRQWGKYLGHGVNFINTMTRDKGLEYTKNYIKQEIEENNKKIA